MLERGSPDTPLAGQRARLRVLATSDLHAHILPYDYFTDRPAPGTGFAQTAGLIGRLRGEVGNSVLLDDGDFLQGTPMSDWAAQSDVPGVHPMIAVMNMLGYDAATLGNHEFNYGLDHLRDVLAAAVFPVVSANLTLSDAADTALVPPWIVLDRTIETEDGARVPLRIGVVGFAPPQIPAWERYTLHGAVAAEGIVQSAAREVPRLRAAGADIVIALCHSGIGAEGRAPDMENAAVPLAALPGIDAIIAGHTHDVFPGRDIAASAAIDPAAGTLHGTPTVMAGQHGSHVGRIDLVLEHDGAGWRIVRHAVRSMPVRAGAAADPRVIEGVRDVHERVLAHIRTPVATSEEPIDSRFALLGPSPVLTILSDAMRDHASRVLGAPDLPLLTAVAPYKSGGRAGPENYVTIPAGPLSVRHAADIYPYPNALCVLRLTGADIADWLETAAQAYARIERGRHDQPLFDPSIPSYNADVIHGLRYVIDPSRPVGARIADLRLADGTVLTPDRAVLLATNGYRAGGGGSYDAALRGETVYEERQPLRDVLLAWMRAQGRVVPRAARVWRFATLEATGAWFDCGPRHKTWTPGAHISRVGAAADGFGRYAIDLSVAATGVRAPGRDAA